MPLTLDEANRVFKLYDVDGNMQLSKDEFVRLFTGEDPDAIEGAVDGPQDLSHIRKTVDRVRYARVLVGETSLVRVG